MSVGQTYDSPFAIYPFTSPWPRHEMRRAGGQAAKKTFDAEVFVYAGPVNAVSAARYLPVRALLGRRMEQSRIPCQRHDNGPAIEEVDA
jgi:hypothetical protein